MMMALTAVGYVATDLIVRTPAINYVRGWARLGVTVANILALICFIDPRIKRLDKIAAGFALSSTFVALLHGGKFVWKFDGAIQLTIAAGALATTLPVLPGSLLLLCAGIVNLSLDCRNAGGISIMVAALLFARLPKTVRKKAGFMPIFLVGLLVAGGLYLGYRMALNDYSERQAESNAGRMADIEVALTEIIKSPIIGHGSWFYSADMQAAIAGEYASLTGHHQSLDDTDISAGHSAVLQSWFEGGLLGAFLFFMLIGKILREMCRQMFKDNSLPISPIFATLMAVACWDLIMSPFAGIHRTTISLGTAALFANQYGDRVLMAILAAKRTTLNTTKAMARS
jgi:O-antigen ligase